MEPDDLGLGSYYHHHHPQPHPQPPPQRHQHPHHQQQQQQQPPSTVTANGMLPTTNNDPRPSQLLYPHNSAPSAVSSPLETGVRRKRGRPRKYGTPEQAAAAKRLSSSSSPSTSVPPLSPASKKDLSLGVSGSSATSFKKYSLGNSGQGFTPHIISVAAGENISQKIMSFMQQSKQETCVLSASGSISNASLRQPTSSGGNITYEGRFDILSLSGSYIRADLGGTGGLSVCLSSNDGQIIGGGVDGPLIAAGPVQVVVGTFSIEGKKESAATSKGDASTNKLPSPNVGPPMVPNLSFLSGPDSSGRNVAGGSDEPQNLDGYQFMIPNRNVPVTDWRTNNDSRNTAGYDFSGRLNQQSPKSGDYDRFQD